MKLPPRQPSQQLEKLKALLMVILTDTLPSESVVARSTVNSMDDDMERWVKAILVFTRVFTRPWMGDGTYRRRPSWTVFDAVWGRLLSTRFSVSLIGSR